MRLWIDDTHPASTGFVLVTRQPARVLFGYDVRAR